MHRLLLFACLLRYLPTAHAQPAQIVDFCHSMWSPCHEEEIGSIAYAHTIGDSLMTEIALQDMAASPFYIGLIMDLNPGYSFADYTGLYEPTYEERYEEYRESHDELLRCCLVPLIVDSTLVGLYAYSGYFIRRNKGINPSDLSAPILVYLSPTEAFVVSPFVDPCRREHYKQVLATFAQRIPGGIHLPCLEKFLPYEMPKEFFTLMGLSFE